ncbi:MAG: hypothetical protein NBV67_00690 [Tagaea sp.]|nr:hypothetical protein [Tagaea sp.]
MKTAARMAALYALVFGVFLAVVAIGGARPAAACDMTAGAAVARETQSAVNTMIDTHRTQCRPAGDGGKCSIICMAETRVANMEGWTLVTGVFAGRSARERGLDKFSYVGLMDRGLGEARKYLRIDLAAASSIQQRMAADRLDLPGGLREIKAATTTVELPPR